MQKTTLLLALILAVASLSWAAGHGKTTKPTAAELATGKAVYDKACAACHATGVMGAPKTGDKAAWKVHFEHGLQHMTEIAIKGVGKMPPKGGHAALSDAEVRAAVAYMMEQSR